VLLILRGPIQILVVLLLVEGAVVVLVLDCLMLVVLADLVGEEHLKVAINPEDLAILVDILPQKEIQEVLL